MKSLSPFLKAFVLSASLLLLVFYTYQDAITQIGERIYYPETGHSIEGEFFDFYFSIPNPELIYGYPITERFISAQGLEVQYFQRARFEWHPDLPEGQQVRLTPVGEALYAPVAPFQLKKNPAICRTFETGFDVCYSFLEFFDQHGGVRQFGLPISEVEQRDGRFVQYFEYARFEWHPDGLFEVQLSFLGYLYFEKVGEDPAWLKPERNGGFIQEILSLRVFAFPVRAVVSSQAGQTIYVIVQDQNLNPVEGVRVTLTLTSPAGAPLTIELEPTNASGFTKADVLPAEGEMAGMVTVEVSARWGDAIHASTRASFRVTP